MGRGDKLRTKFLLNTRRPKTTTTSQRPLASANESQDSEDKGGKEAIKMGYWARSLMMPISHSSWGGGNFSHPDARWWRERLTLIYFCADRARKIGRESLSRFLWPRSSRENGRAGNFGTIFGYVSVRPHRAISWIEIIECKRSSFSRVKFNEFSELEKMAFGDWGGWLRVF